MGRGSTLIDIHTCPTLIPHVSHTSDIHTYISSTLVHLSGWPRSRIRQPLPPRSTGRRPRKGGDGVEAPTPRRRPPPPPPRPRGDGDRFRRTRKVGPVCNQFDNPNQNIILQSLLRVKIRCSEALCMRGPVTDVSDSSLLLTLAPPPHTSPPHCSFLSCRVLLRAEHLLDGLRHHVRDLVLLRGAGACV